MTTLAENKATEETEEDRARAGPPITRARRFLIYLAWIGPGIIAANAGNEAGGIVT